MLNVVIRPEWVKWCSDEWIEPMMLAPASSWFRPLSSQLRYVYKKINSAIFIILTMTLPKLINLTWPTYSFGVLLAHCGHVIPHDSRIQLAMIYKTKIISLRVDITNRKYFLLQNYKLLHSTLILTKYPFLQNQRYPNNSTDIRKITFWFLLTYMIQRARDYGY